MPLSTTSDEDLDHLMKDIPHYRGAHSQDWCKGKSPNQEEYVILNLDSEDGPGNHWICICNLPDSPLIEYFDSYGLPIPEQVLRYMKKSKKQVVSTTNEIQSLDSKACGYYCVFYLKERERRTPTYDILYQFSPTAKDHNDKLLENLLEHNKMIPVEVYDLRGHKLSEGTCQEHELREVHDMINHLHNPKLKRGFNEVEIRVGGGFKKKIRYEAHLPLM